jgi:hypothetical protein
MNYFSPFNHRIESYTVGGGSRYDIESSPVYEAFHKDIGDAPSRLGWLVWTPDQRQVVHGRKKRGCGHLFGKSIHPASCVGLI